ncbi:MAG: PAS domain S-box protein [Desulfarculus sp.]|nr:PAS domain S-box protein [Desulfarculus sp.]
MSQGEGWDFRRLFDNHSAMMMLVDPRTLAILDVNRACERFYGYDRDEFQHLRIPDLNLMSEDQLRTYMVDPTNAGREHHDMRHRLKNGQIREVEVRSDPIAMNDGRVVRFVVITDITLRKEQERELRASEARLRRLVESTPEAIIIAQHGRIVYANPAAEKISGYKAEELSRIHYLDLVPPEDQEALRQNHQRRLRGLPIPESYEVRFFSKNKELKWVAVNGMRIEHEGAPATLNFLTDITQRKRDEAERLQQERLQAAVATAGAACHELNQPLQGVLIQLELSLLKLPPDSPLRPELERALDLARQMAKITQNLNRLTDYRTRVYLDNTRILDLDESIS